VSSRPTTTASVVIIRAIDEVPIVAWSC
jgi:hypothetical protein